ncbi:MAG: calcium:sodium antiporter [Flavobacteriaceae bacterium]|nr:calcium:sodium antiporter [Flavobacteriaceae bacterium]
MFINISLLIVSIATLVIGAERFVDASSKIAKNFGISDLFVGLTIVALGTSAPEIFVAISSVINSVEVVAIGTIVGSNITNIALIFGVSCFAVNQIKRGISLESLIPFLLSFLLFLFALKDLRFTLMESLGFILILFYFLVILSKERSEAIEVVSVNSDIVKDFIMLLMGLVLLVVGSNFSVIYAEKFALSIGISEVIVGLTVLALGTSLPELAATLSAIFKGKNQMVIGNIVGSNILNLVVIVPIIGIFSSAIMPIELWERDSFPLIILTLTFTLIMLFLSGKEISKFFGAILGFLLLSFYIVYVLNLSSLINVF